MCAFAFCNKYCNFLTGNVVCWVNVKLTVLSRAAHYVIVCNCKADTGFSPLGNRCLIGKAFSAKKKKAAPAQEPAPVEVVEEPSAPVAPGSAGQLKLYDTPPKTAAMLMAIVADKMGKPLNELRFISIKEVK